MELKIIRKNKSLKTTIGELYVDGVFLCNTLEDVDRHLTQSTSLDKIQAIKVQDKTAIPTGRYEVIVDQSTRFKKLMPHILNVPGFEGIRIHCGNTDADTDGCILLGTKIGDMKDTIINSKIAFSKFFPRLQEGLKKGNVFINII